MQNLFAFIGKLWEMLARRVDRFLMASAVAIVGVGLVALFSASDQNAWRVTSQLASLGFALVLMWIVANVAPQQLSRAALPLYAVSVLLLVAVALGGTMVNGSRRWLNLGIGRFQPSELVKVALPLMLAWYFQKHEGRVRFADFIVAAVLIALPVWLIKRQPDLGTALMIGASGIFVLYLAGLSWRIMAGLAVLAAADAERLRRQATHAAELGTAHAHEQVTVFRLLAGRAAQLRQADDRSSFVRVVRQGICY